MHSFLWGPFAWYIIHSLAYHYIDNQREKYVQFYRSLQQVLPCEVCRNHYGSMIARAQYVPESNTGRETIHQWTVNMHNEVNRRLNKRVVSIQESTQLYQTIDHNRIYVFLDLMIHLGLKKNTYERITNLMAMLLAITELYPCEYCRMKLKNYAESNPLTAENMATWCGEWLQLLHEHANYGYAKGIANGLLMREEQITQIQNRFRNPQPRNQQQGRARPVPQVRPQARAVPQVRQRARVIPQMRPQARAIPQARPPQQRAVPQARPQPRAIPLVQRPVRNVAIMHRGMGVNRNRALIMRQQMLRNLHMRQRVIALKQRNRWVRK